VATEQDVVGMGLEVRPIAYVKVHLLPTHCGPTRPSKSITDNENCSRWQGGIGEGLPLLNIYGKRPRSPGAG